MSKCTKCGVEITDGSWVKSDPSGSGSFHSDCANPYHLPKSYVHSVNVRTPKQMAEAVIVELEKKLALYSKYAPFHLDQAVGADVCSEAIAIIKRVFAEELK